MDPKYAVDLFANRYQSLDSKRVVSTGGQGGSLEQTEGKDEGMWRRWKRREGERDSEKTEEEREREPVCLCVCLYTSVCWRKDFKDPAEQRLLRFFTFFSTKAPLALDPPSSPFWLFICLSSKAARPIGFCRALLTWIFLLHQRHLLSLPHSASTVIERMIPEASHKVYWLQYWLHYRQQCCCLFLPIENGASVLKMHFFHW